MIIGLFACLILATLLPSAIPAGRQNARTIAAVVIVALMVIVWVRYH